MMRRPGKIDLIRCFSTVAAIVAAPVATAHAALITGTTNASPTFTTDITAVGTTDWAYWHSTNTTPIASRAPLNRMSGGTAVISNVTGIAATCVRGSSSSTTDAKFSFTNGTPTASGTSASLTGVFSEPLDSVNTGVQVTLKLPDTQIYKVSVWVSGYNGQGKLTATLPGATTYQDTSFTYTATKSAKLYELQVQANQAADTLTLSHTLSIDSPGAGFTNSHVILAGVAISPVPEPMSLSLLGAAGLLLKRRRRG